MKQVFLIILMALSFRGHCQQQDNKLTIGIKDTIYSETLKERRTIWVHMPDTTDHGFYNKEHYPVLYLLDADAHFYATTGTVQFMSEVNNLFPKMIIVGILSRDRMHDLTPTHDRTVPRDSNLVRTSGGGEQFTKFLRDELMPYINSHYPTAPYNILVGHSLGGLLVVNTLANHPEMFNAYVALDPALYWDNQKTLKQAEVVLKEKKFAGKSFFLGVSKSMPQGMDTASILQDTTLATIFIRPILKLDRAVKASSGNLHYSWKYYEDETHNTLPLVSTYDALRFIFDFMKLPEISRDAATADFYINHYKIVSQKMGYKLSPPEDLINGKGYYFLEKKMYDRAYTFFQLNIESYPESYNVYDSMSDFYAAQNDKDKAITFLNKELTLKDKPYIREKLAKLKVGK